MTLNESANQLLDQLGQVTRQLSNEQFRQPIAILSNSSIGQHVRHTLEFFICLMDAKNDNRLNYDNRRHDKFIEQEVDLALTVIQRIKEFVDGETGDFALQLDANYTVDQDQIISINSNFFRELAYNVEHAIHHMALIKIGLSTTFQFVQIPDHFGVASSTVRYQQNG